MKKIFKRISTKTSLYFFVFAMLIVLLLSYTSYQQSLSILMDNKQKQTQQEIENAAQYISAYLDKIQGLTALMSMSPKMKEILRADEENDAYVKTLIEVVQQNDPIIKRIAVISRNGKMISTSDCKFCLGPDMLQMPWYKKLLESPNSVIVTTDDHESFSMQKSERLISITHAINDEIDGVSHHVGLIIVDLSSQFVEDHVAKMNFGSQGYAFITTSEEKLLFDSKQVATDALVENNNYKKLIKDRMKSLEGGLVGATITVPNTDWILVGVASTEDVNRLTLKIVDSIVVSAVIVLVLSIFLAVLISKWVTKPVVGLIAEMKQVKADFKPITIDTNASVEIRELSLEYNLLLARIHKLTVNIEEKERAKRLFEVKALQSQINPHFIYNTLDTIMWLVELEEREKAVQVIKLLGDLLRGSLSLKHDFVELRQELEHVQNYMDIQKIRYDDKFDYDIVVASTVPELLVPKLILQPIIENSIYHGIKPKAGRAKIKINVDIQGQDLLIIVEDNGVGPAEKTKTEKLKTIVNPKLGGIGMKNVNQRIKILCGDEYGIKLMRNGDWTQVVYKLKKIEETIKD